MHWLNSIRRAVQSYTKCLNYVEICPSTLLSPLVPRMLHSSRQQYPALITTNAPHAGSSARKMPHRALFSGIGLSHTPAVSSAASLQHHHRPNLLLCRAQRGFCNSSTSNPSSSLCSNSTSSSSTIHSSRSSGWVLGQHIQQQGAAGRYLQRQVVCAAFHSSSSSSSSKSSSKTKSRYVCQECGEGEGVLREGRGTSSRGRKGQQQKHLATYYRRP